MIDSFGAARAHIVTKAASFRRSRMAKRGTTSSVVTMLLFACGSEANAQQRQISRDSLTTLAQSEVTEGKASFRLATCGTDGAFLFVFDRNGAKVRSMFVSDAARTALPIEMTSKVFPEIPPHEVAQAVNAQIVMRDRDGNRCERSAVASFLSR
jgi:hypothetical protein